MPPAELACFSGLINAGHVKELLLDKDFCLVLHGQMHAGWFGVEEIVREGTKITVTVCRHVYDGGAAWHAGPKLDPFSPRDYDR